MEGVMKTLCLILTQMDLCVLVLSDAPTAH